MTQNGSENCYTTYSLSAAWVYRHVYVAALIDGKRYTITAQGGSCFQNFDTGGYEPVPKRVQ